VRPRRERCGRSRVEAGARISPDYQNLLCRLFHTGPVQLGLAMDYSSPPPVLGSYPEPDTVLELAQTRWAPERFSFPSTPRTLDWAADTLVALSELGRVAVDIERRRVLGVAAYSVAAISVPDGSWWTRMVGRGKSRDTADSHSVGRGDLDAVRDMAAVFSRVDQRRGGGHASTAVVQYLTSDVAGYLRGHFPDDQVRREMFSAASELAYLAGWMAFDNVEHAVAQHYFTTAVKLAAEADDPPMAAHVLRAMAHQAVDLGHPRQALDLATASMEGKRYALASPRERALIGVVYARSLAAAGHQHAATALIRAENDLAAAESGDNEPSRVFFFGEASLAHETACALRDTGNLAGAVRQFRRSVRTRKAATFTRTHAVTLGYLGAVQARQRDGIEEACATWSKALDAMDGIRSGRTRQIAVDMRAVLSPFRRRGIRTVVELDARAATYLAGIA
jgi:hypothetical protein